MGIATFERIYHTMSSITGVPFTNTAVTRPISSVQQAMPSAPQINAFLPSHQTAISQMASAYCTQLVGTPSTLQYVLRRLANPGFATLNSSLTATASSFFGTTGAQSDQHQQRGDTAGERDRRPGRRYPQAAAGMTTELNALLPRIPTLNPAETVSQATIAACSAALGSAAATVQ